MDPCRFSLDPYCMRMAVRALAQPRQRAITADAVGLGKRWKPADFRLREPDPRGKRAKGKTGILGPSKVNDRICSGRRKSLKPSLYDPIGDPALLILLYYKRQPTFYQPQPRCFTEFTRPAISIFDTLQWAETKVIILNNITSTRSSEKCSCGIYIHVIDEAHHADRELCHALKEILASC